VDKALPFPEDDRWDKRSTAGFIAARIKKLFAVNEIGGIVAV